jgi:tRNA threonylcarbamoyl adenosine modification protein YeaZ
VLLLALDTATPAVTVALHDGHRVVAQQTTVDARRQGELLAPAIRQALTAAGAAMADVSVIVAGAGPGPYTGLRAGLVTARVLGSALGVPVHGLCTLDVIAAEAAAAAGRAFLVATDARRRELYWARYSAAGERLSGPAVAAAPAAPTALPAGLPVAGEGAHLYPELLGAPVEPRYPAAATLAVMAAERLAAGGPFLPPAPLYLRRPDARVPGPPKPVSGRPAAARGAAARGTAALGTAASGAAASGAAASGTAAPAGVAAP